ncbi:MAG: hypothetical protein WED09_05225 [Homoserinimonas sp.]
MTRKKRKAPSTAFDSRRARLAAFAGAAKLTPEERSERARKGAAAMWAKDAARREAEGLPPRKPAKREPSAHELEVWLLEVDKRWPDREWPYAEARRRQALILAREYMARAEMEYGDE